MADRIGLWQKQSRQRLVLNTVLKTLAGPRPLQNVRIHPLIFLYHLCVSLYVCLEGSRGSVGNSSPSFPSFPSFLPSFFPSFLSSFFPFFLPIVLLSFLPSLFFFISSFFPCLPTVLLSHLYSFHPFILSSFHASCHPTFLILMSPASAVERSMVCLATLTASMKSMGNQLPECLIALQTSRIAPHLVEAHGVHGNGDISVARTVDSLVSSGTILPLVC